MNQNRPLPFPGSTNGKLNGQQQPQQAPLPEGTLAFYNGLPCPQCGSTFTAAQVQVISASKMLVPGMAPAQAAQAIKFRCLECNTYMGKEEIERKRAELEADIAKQKEGQHDAPPTQ